jgi:glycosyltransferase involved in cell wall biosynthesis
MERAPGNGFDGKGHVLLISQDVVGKQMAGPGVRYYNLARVLSQEFNVVLAVPRESVPDDEQRSFLIVQYSSATWTSIEPWVNQARVVFFPSDIATVFPQLGQSDVPLVVDGFDPLLAEWMALGQMQPQEQMANWATRVRNLTQQYLLGDFFVCASERQRDWWLGLLEANGRVNFWTFQEDPSLRCLVDVVPFGLPETAPGHSRQVIKGIWPGIGERDRVILWGGGIWPWLDPVTAIRAMAIIWEQRRDVRLIFPGTQRPNAILANIPVIHVQEARDVAAQLGLLDKAVFFGDWVPYQDWPNVLLESDIAVTLHHEDSLETRLAFRSRILDYIWAGLPVVATRGDATSELIAAHQVGITVPGGDSLAVAQGIIHLLDTPNQSFASHFERVRQSLTWEHAAQPLIEFCRHPRRAPDRVAQREHLGNPFYTTKVEELQAQVNQLQALVGAYEQRRAVRLANQVYHIRERLGWL